MNIVYSSSDSYSELCGISLTSLLENNKNINEINIYVIDNNIKKENKEKLINTAKKYSRQLSFINSFDFHKIIDDQVYVGRWNISTYFRLYLGSLLPKKVKKVLYLDCDTIVRKDLESLYSIPLDNFAAAGADDCRSDLYRKELGLENGTVYINNGVLLLNLELIRNLGLEEKFTKYISDKHGNCTYMDQAPLNSVLGKQTLIREIEPKYNAQRIFFDFSYNDLINLRKPTHYLSKEDYDCCTNDPYIVHFTPVFISGTRPWQIKDNHKFRKEFLYYKQLSEWKNCPLWKDDRKLPKKIMTRVCKMMPKFLLIPIMSYLHAVWYPKKRIRLAEKDKLKNSF